MKNIGLGLRGLFLLLTLAVVACGESGDGTVTNNNGTAEVRISLGGSSAQTARAAHAPSGATNLPAEIIRVDLIVTSQSGDLSPISASLPLDGSPLSLMVPAGSNRIFTLEAYAGGILRMSGATMQSLQAGTRATVSITLNDLATLTGLPATLDLLTSASYQFSATVTAHADTSVSWSVDGVMAGNTSIGTISDGGIYMVPIAVPSPDAVTVRATSNADATLFAETVVTVSAAVVNNAPVASGVSVTDNNGGSVVVGDSLTGSYTYSDAENDSEAGSTFRWLRDGVAIISATSVTYTLVAADADTNITFEVTPAAATGTTTGTAVTSTGIAVINSAPVASAVSITDDNGGNALEGDALTGNYSYTDVDGDLESASTFRWLRDGTPISGATLVNYTLVAADVPADIVFEVTPIAASGTITGSPVASFSLGTGVSPMVTGFARYLDINTNAVSDANDQLIVPFDRAVSTTAVLSSDFDLLVTGDSFGVGATVAAGPQSNEVTITLGTSPKLTTQNTFSSLAKAANSPSGIDIAAFMVANAIEDATTGIDAVPSIPLDLIPGFVDSGQQLGVDLPTYGIATGDLDGDGDLDVVMANLGGNSGANRVYFNDGSGSFTDSGQALGFHFGQFGLVPNDSYDVALGDVDNDGDLDMVVGNHNVTRNPPNDQTNRLYLNDGNGFFTDTQSLGSAGVSFGITMGDVNGDGSLDVVVANMSVPNQVYINDGSGVFTDSGQALGGTNRSTDVTLGDIDADGDLDLVVQNAGDGIQVYDNDGSGTFTNTGQTLATASTGNIALGDVDKDGDLDMVAVNRFTGTRVYLNDGSGLYTDTGQVLSDVYISGGATEQVALGDVDGDGDLDMVMSKRLNLGTCDGVNASNRVFLNDGNGTYADSGQPLASTSNCLDEGVALGDMDNDGDLDIIFTNSRGAGGGASQVSLNSLSGTRGAMTYVDSQQLLGTTSSIGIASGDLDGDGDLDMVVANGASGVGNQVYFNDGTSAFTDSGQSLGANDSRAVALGDLDGDGDLDMVVANVGVANRVYRNDGSGAFTDSGQTLGSTSFITGFSKGIVLGDIDDDGDLDIVVTNYGAANRVYRNDGSGAFTDSGQRLGGTNSSEGIVLGDIDGDGDLDMVVNNNSEGRRVYRNDGTGTFTDTGQILSSNSGRDLTLGDVDGDGDLDMVAINAYSGTRIYLNDGSGVFTDTGQALAPQVGLGATREVALGDVDGDGDLDLVLAKDPSWDGNPCDSSILYVTRGSKVYQNDGNGVFTDTGQTLGGNCLVQSVTLGDVDGDGDLDIMFGNGYLPSMPNLVYLNSFAGN